MHTGRAKKLHGVQSQMVNGRLQSPSDSQVEPISKGSRKRKYDEEKNIQSPSDSQVERISEGTRKRKYGEEKN